MTHGFPEGYSPLNFCRGCGFDFTSLGAFDQHRAGDWSDRFCLDPGEAGLELRDTRLGVDRWGIPMTEAKKASLAALKASS